MSKYSSGLTKKLIELNGGYDPDFFSIGRLVTMIGNPYGLYSGLSTANKLEMVEIIRGNKENSENNSLSHESFNVAYDFVKTLLSNKYGMKIPKITDAEFSRVDTYGDYLKDLLKMRKSTVSTCAKDNIDTFLKSPHSGFFRGKLEKRLLMKSFEPKEGPVVRVSFRTKTRQSFIEKTLERFIRFDQDVVQKNYIHPITKHTISGKDIFQDYFRRFKASGLDLYEFWETQNPKYGPTENDPDLSDIIISNSVKSELKTFKDRFIGTFPIDHDGAKIIVRTINDAHYLAEEFLKHGISNYHSFPIHLRLCEDNITGKCKDGSYTLGIGARETKKQSMTNELIQSGMTEIKILYSAAAVESGFGKDNDIVYKTKTKKRLIDALNSGNMNYITYYLNLCYSFGVEPELLM